MITIDLLQLLLTVLSQVCIIHEYLNGMMNNVSQIVYAYLPLLIDSLTAYDLQMQYGS